MTRLDRQPTEQVRSPAEKPFARSFSRSRSSTDRAGAITGDRPRRLIPVGVSIVNRPSRCDHLPRPRQRGSVLWSRSSTDRAGAITPCRDGAASHARGSRSSTDRAGAITRGGRPRRRLHTVSIVNRPSRCDHATTRSDRSQRLRLDRQPTEQVRSHVTAAVVVALARVSIVNRPSRCDHPLPPREIASRLRSRSSTDRAGAITLEQLYVQLEITESRSSTDRAGAITEVLESALGGVLLSRSSTDRAGAITVVFYSVVTPRAYIDAREHISSPRLAERGVDRRSRRRV